MRKWEEKKRPSQVIVVVAIQTLNMVFLRFHIKIPFSNVIFFEDSKCDIVSYSDNTPYTGQPNLHLVLLKLLKWTVLSNGFNKTMRKKMVKMPMPD